MNTKEDKMDRILNQLIELYLISTAVSSVVWGVLTLIKIQQLIK